jgi:excisionase family DNA binding protein
MLGAKTNSSHHRKRNGSATAERKTAKRSVLRETVNGEGRNLREVARDLKEAKEVLGAIEARTLAGVAATLSEAADSLSRTAERLERMGLQEWMGPDEAAAYLGRSKHAFQKAVAHEGVPKHYLTGRRPLFNRRELDEWLLNR